MGYKYVLDPNVITADGIDDIKRRRNETGVDLFRARKELLADQRNNAISALQAGLSNPDNIAAVLHDTLELLRSTKT